MAFLILLKKESKGQGAVVIIQKNYQTDQSFNPLRHSG